MRSRRIETPSPDFQQDLEAMLDAITPKTRIVFIPNPNNPTGTLISQREIDRFMSRVSENIIVVFDEAYFEFLDHPPNTLQFVRDDRNVVVLRTFSKIHGLAGLRVGYGVARPDLIEVLHKTRQPFNVFQKLLARKVIVRPLKGYNLSEWVRISVGTMEQNRKCIAALKQILRTDRQA